MHIGAGQFKARCLKLMDEVKKRHEEIVITKHGKPVARLVPVQDEPRKSLFGFLKDAVAVHGDIVGPVEEKWDADE